MEEANHKLKIMKFKIVQFSVKNCLKFVQFLKLLAIQVTKNVGKNHQENTLKTPKYPAAYIVWK